MTRQRLCIVSTTATPLRVFMGPHIEALAKEYEIVLVCNGEAGELQNLLGEHVSFVGYPIQRNISFWKDFQCVLWLYRFLRAGNFTAVHTLMPKSGLLGMLAARLVGTKHRFHSFTGQVWATRTGIMRAVLKLMDKLLCICATRLLTDSMSQLDYLVEQGIVMRHRIEVLADGSISGVDIGKFGRNAIIRQEIRTEFGIPQNATVFLFLGRVTTEKGISELLDAFMGVASRITDAHLMIVGPLEADYEQSIENARSVTKGRVHRVGFTTSPESYMSTADIFCLPSYREGFGTVIIEAAAAGLPTIASRIYGVTDAVEDGKTGLLHKVRDKQEMEVLMEMLARDESQRATLGQAAYQRTVTRFSQQRLVEAMLEFYRGESVGRCTVSSPLKN
ncbi:glycosyltransferase family 4 protein [Chania multitudinisentens]|uniref:glycosyltransferase family 4 protein n=1 Tax=Chania multitudinisentens TaxID=1639108 RepID=UPI0003E1301A|nr:glycosyltransferase family 4 protein [Chania multitudinisentens]